MNLIRKDVLRLKKELIKQLIEFLLNEGIKPGEPIPISRIPQKYWFDDGKEWGQHTVDHGQLLSEKNAEYLFRQADDIFEEESYVVKGQIKICWAMKPAKSTESAAPESTA